MSGMRAQCVRSRFPSVVPLVIFLCLVCVENVWCLHLRRPVGFAFVPLVDQSPFGFQAQERVEAVGNEVAVTRTASELLQSSVGTTSSLWPQRGGETAGRLRQWGVGVSPSLTEGVGISTEILGGEVKLSPASAAALLWAPDLDRYEFDRESVGENGENVPPIAAFREEVQRKGFDVASFAGGCFWCVESDLEAVPGVNSVISGYEGGTVAFPSYKEVCRGRTGHKESVLVVFDPKVISYDALVDRFFHSIDPTDPRGQFCDKGASYRSAVFYLDDAQRQAAWESRKALEKEALKGQPVVTEIVKAPDFFWPAEGYHQNYYITTAPLYKYYRQGCGRDVRVADVWGQTFKEYNQAMIKAGGKA
uniref:peptide-methionine (S)-S-oxide reductase n=1 Tax=Chromera velia CCMP2878 TaxID=1169474 RepID=A0A0G4FPD0_9ALVE|eukprot:Cvel_18052.t1-p1 / transcript=Cvel_18052.t1 / gene=Cvel_18052 / organism=Chromera_velia_CCMP2878 / gene_product=Peptide methionine sulfoxide reductase MsrA, putative / transcript_product=Peptide methionine sulfoxide reductase MsrA, putative / location=Cvel_scaffold1474:34510-37698(-) / protein_length=362 / sequence_SO=supercontig / SO=protein_coding / is_pseudo=false